MKIQILGTAAAEAWPALFCECTACTKARELGGKNYRTRSSLQIDGKWKIDFPPDSLYHAHHYGLDFTQLRHLFFTHSHEDHMDVNDLALIGPPFGHNHFSEAPLNLYMSADAKESFEKQLQGFFDRSAANFHILEPFEPVQMDEMKVTPLLASHMPHEQCLFYLLEKDNRCVLYSSDTGPFPQETLDYLAKQKIDLYISECTYGPVMDEKQGHMSLGDVIRMRDHIINAGAFKADNPVWVTHFSHNVHVTHAEFEAIANPHGIQVAYDGVMIEI